MKVRDADRIVVLEEGDHQELLSSGGTYARLVSTQLVSASAQSPAGE